jgi:hypothetical protein
MCGRDVGARLTSKEDAVHSFYGARRRRDHQTLRHLVTVDVVFHELEPRRTRVITLAPTSCSSGRRGTFTLTPTDAIETDEYAGAQISWFAERGGARSEGLELAVFRFRGGRIAEVSFHRDSYDLETLREVFG